MDIKALQLPEIQQFILSHQNEDVNKLALKLGKNKHPLASEILNQIKGRQKAKNKIPLWLRECIVFPPALSLEQSSSEQTAKFKSGLVSGKKLIDLSAGFGVDAYHFSKTFEEIVLVEPNQELLALVKHNFECLEVRNASFVNAVAGDFILNNKVKADCIYVDPSRRSGNNQRLYRLSDCQPNIPELLPYLWNVAPRILIKTAPILDLQAAIAELGHVRKVIVLSLLNEVKEVLYLLEKDFQGEAAIEAIDLKKSGNSIFTFSQNQEKQARPELSVPLQYLYEPNAAILKAGAFKSIADSFKLFKLHQHTHLYTSEKLFGDFPGRVFKIKSTSKPDKKSLKKILPEMKANVTLRNYSGSVGDFLKMTGIKEGGEIYLFATTLMDEKPWVVVCEKTS